MKKLVTTGVDMSNKRAIGSFYEAAAIRFFEAEAYQLIAKNQYTPFGEIDLILMKNNVLYFVEVKFRASDAYGTPRESINPRKITHMKRSAMHYLKENRSNYQAYKIAFMGITRENGTLNFDFIENIFS